MTETFNRTQVTKVTVQDGCMNAKMLRKADKKLMTELIRQ